MQRQPSKSTSSAHKNSRDENRLQHTSGFLKDRASPGGPEASAFPGNFWEAIRKGPRALYFNLTSQPGDCCAYKNFRIYNANFASVWTNTTLMKRRTASSSQKFPDSARHWCNLSGLGTFSLSFFLFFFPSSLANFPRARSQFNGRSEWFEPRSFKHFFLAKPFLD